MQRRDAGGETFDKRDIVNHMIFLMMAAHDTSSAAVTAVAYFLAKNPDWQERCRAESLALGDGPVDLAGTESLVCLDLVFQEALRLVTPIPAVIRMATEDTEILGRYIPEGTHISVAAATHLLADYWRDPSQFDPERFAEPRREDKATRGANLPFGGGVHKCIGMHFGRSEVKAMIHRLLLTYRLDLPDDYEVSWEITALVSPSGGLPITLRPLAPRSRKRTPREHPGAGAVGHPDQRRTAAEAQVAGAANRLVAARQIQAQLAKFLPPAFSTPGLGSDSRLTAVRPCTPELR